MRRLAHASALVLASVLSLSLAPPASATTISHGHTIRLADRGYYLQMKRRTLKEGGSPREARKKAKYGKHGGWVGGSEVLNEGAGCGAWNGPADWSPPAGESDHACMKEIRAGGIRIAGDTVVRHAATTDRWGNALTPYWMGRLVAFIGGYNFNGGMSGGDWMSMLPLSASAKDTCRSKALWEESCKANKVYGANRPTGYFYTYGHSYSIDQMPNVLRAFQPTIVKDTRSAMEGWANEHKAKIPKFEADDVVIGDRCHGGDSLLGHRAYGSMGFSYYHTIPGRDTKRKIFIVFNPSHTTKICKERREALAKHLRERYMGAEVVLKSGDRFEDWAMLVYAPRLYVDHGSWGLWAGLANDGHVHAPAMFNCRQAIDKEEMYFKTYPLSSLGPLSEKWHWSDAPVLSNYVAKEELGIEADNGKHDDPKTIYKCIKWFKGH